jgi:hypothetical protein
MNFMCKYSTGRYAVFAWFLVSLSATVMALTVRASLVASLLGESNEFPDPLKLFASLFVTTPSPSISKRCQSYYIGPQVIIARFVQSLHSFIQKAGTLRRARLFAP